MIVVRDIFRVKFGKSKEVTDLFKQGITIAQRAGFGALGLRLLTDLAGEPYYTLIMETTFESAAAWEQASLVVRGSAEWRGWYQKVLPLIDGGERKLYSVVE
jgi:hypothetical protein